MLWLRCQHGGWAHGEKWRARPSAGRVVLWTLGSYSVSDA